MMYHAHLHLVLNLRSTSSEEQPARGRGEPKIRWKHGEEERWRMHTSEAAFQQKLRTLVAAATLQIDALHHSVETLIEEEAVAAGVATVHCPREHPNPTKGLATK